MNVESITLSKIAQTQKDKYHMFSEIQILIFICVHTCGGVYYETREEMEREKIGSEEVVRDEKEANRTHVT